MADILANRLKIWPREIENNLREVYVTVKEGNLTVWVVAPKGFIKRIFNTAARVKDPDYSFTSHIPAAARNRRIAIEEKLKVQKQSDPDLKYNIRPGYNDLVVMIKHKTSLIVANPYRPLNLDEFYPDNVLPPIETVAMKIHNNTVFETNMREKLMRAQERAKADDAEEDTGEGGSWNKSKKRGFMSPLNNADKKSKIDDSKVKSIIDRLLPRPQASEADDSSDSESSQE